VFSQFVRDSPSSIITSSFFLFFTEIEKGQSSFMPDVLFYSPLAFFNLLSSSHVPFGLFFFPSSLFLLGALETQSHHGKVLPGDVLYDYCKRLLPFFHAKEFYSLFCLNPEKAFFPYVLIPSRVFPLIPPKHIGFPRHAL